MISFIVPIYNAAKYLEACIRSLQDQTERDIQILLVDDGSTDDSLLIARRFAAEDDRITVLEQVHAGQSTARNLALDQAKGEYIAFVDADDRLESDWCTHHLAAIDGADYVQSGYKRVKDGRINKPNYPKGPYRFTVVWARLYRREAIEAIRFAEGHIYEDVRFSIHLWLSGAKATCISYAGYLYTDNPESTTSQAHPDEQRQLFEFLYQAWKESKFIKHKRIIAKTILRLKLHYRKLNLEN